METFNLRVRVINIYDSTTFILPNEMIQTIDENSFIIKLSKKSSSPELSDLEKLNSKTQIEWFKDWDWLWICENLNDLSGHLRNKLNTFKTPTLFSDLFNN